MPAATRSFSEPWIQTLTLRVSVSASFPARLLSPGGCTTTDFAVDSLFLNRPASAPTPEPGGFVLILAAAAAFAFHKKVGLSPKALCAAAAAVIGTGMLHAQDPVPFPPGGAPYLGIGSALSRSFPKAGNSASLAGPVAPALPIWSYSLTSPIDSNLYSGYMVGTSPYNRGARSTTIPVVLIPVIATFTNTTSGFTTTFDPTSAPDAGCTANQTALSLVENSPVFQSQSWTMNGVSVGSTQYVDAFRRANFWQYVQNTGNAYHVLLSYTVGTPLLLSVNYSSPTLDHEVSLSNATGSCTNPSVSGVTNGGRYTGVVNINTMDAALQSYIAANGITANQFPLFIAYNIVNSLPSNPGFFDGGYHASEQPYPAALTSPGQTYSIAGFQTAPFFSNPNLNSGLSILTHEVAEWMDDPGVFNATPAWGHIGQVSGCQNNLEVGDALTGSNITVPGPGGFTYALQ